MRLLLSIYSSRGKRKLPHLSPEKKACEKKDLSSKIFLLEGVHRMQSIPPFDYRRHITFQRKPSPPLPPNPRLLIRKDHSTV
jgi:hypothetical protein